MCKNGNEKKMKYSLNKVSGSKHKQREGRRNIRTNDSRKH